MTTSVYHNSALLRQENQPSRRQFQSLADLLPEEDEARRNGQFEYGLYAQVPGKDLRFLSPVYTYVSLRVAPKNLHTVEGSARADALDDLREFGGQFPDLVVSLRVIATGELVQEWTGADVTATGTAAADSAKRKVAA